MQELDDNALLREYVTHHSEAAFAELVARHVDKVYSTALRHTRNPHQAGEITQAVFVILAQKAGKISGQRWLRRPRRSADWRRGVAATPLSGWLYQTARLTAVTLLRGEIRRARREQEALMQTLQTENEPDHWRHIAPLLDDALARLGEKDRHAVVLRFFDGKSFGEVGATLGGSEDAAKMRVSRALEKLRKFFAKRGVTLTAAAIAGAVSVNSVHAAPAGLAKTISAVALAKGAAASGSTLALAKGALKLMAWSKAKTAIVAGVVVLLAAGTTAVAVKKYQEHRTYPWQIEGFDSRVLERQPPQVRILPSKVKYASWGTAWDKNGHRKLMGTGISAQTVVLNAYNFSYSVRMIGRDRLPAGKYNYIACLPTGNEDALQKEVEKKFGVMAKREIQTQDVLLLEIQNPNADGLKKSRANSQNGAKTQDESPGVWSCKNSPVSTLAAYLENYLAIPVIDQTGLTNNFDISLKWKQLKWGENKPDELKRAVLEQLGLELVPTNMPIEMLVVEKAK